MYGDKTDTSAPTATECFATDMSYLTNTDIYSYTGTWLTWNYDLPTMANRYMYSDNGDFTTSYDYHIDNGLYGYAIGTTSSNGQIGMSNWYEAGDYIGLYLYVAKNDTYFYSLWWWYPTMSQFNYSNVNNGAYYGNGTSWIDTSVQYTSLDDANIYSCYQLYDQDDEEVCYNAINSNEYDDDYDDMNGNLLISSLVFVLLNFILLCYLLYKIHMNSKTTPLSNQSTSDMELSKI